MNRSKLLLDKQQRLYKDINKLYYESDGTRTLENCCNELGIGKATYYNYKKKFSHEGSSQRGAGNIPIKSHHKISNKTSQKTPAIERPRLSKDFEVELITNRDKKSSHKNSQKSIKETSGIFKNIFADVDKNHNEIWKK